VHELPISREELLRALEAARDKERPIRGRHEAAAAL